MPGMLRHELVATVKTCDAESMAAELQYRKKLLAPFRKLSTLST